MKRHSRLILSDLHIPFHDKRLLESWFRYLEEYEWAGVDIIGDFLDCYTLSRFDTNPRRKENIQTELDQGREILERIRELQPCTDIRYSEGNHEDRLRKILWGTSKALGPLRNLTIPELLGFNDLNITWHRTEEPYKIGGLWYSHGDLLRKNAGSSARAKGDAMGGSLIMGHTHRMGSCPRTLHTGTYDAYEVGYMADRNKLDYHRHVLDWQLGWAEVLFVGPVHQVNFFRAVDKGRQRFVVGPEGVEDSWRTKGNK
jgi:hypothetical protein